MVFKKEYSPLDFMPIYGFFSFDLVERSIAYGLRDILEQMTPGTLDSLDPAEMANIAWALQQLQIRCDLAKKKRGIFKGKKFCEFGNQEACYAHHCLCVCVPADTSDMFFGKA